MVTHFIRNNIFFTKIPLNPLQIHCIRWNVQDIWQCYGSLLSHSILSGKLRCVSLTLMMCPGLWAVLAAGLPWTGKGSSWCPGSRAEATTVGCESGGPRPHRAHTTAAYHSSPPDPPSHGPSQLSGTKCPPGHTWKVHSETCCSSNLVVIYNMSL